MYKEMLAQTKVRPLVPVAETMKKSAERKAYSKNAVMYAKARLK